LVDGNMIKQVLWISISPLQILKSFQFAISFK